MHRIPQSSFNSLCVDYNLCQSDWLLLFIFLFNTLVEASSGITGAPLSPTQASSRTSMTALVFFLSLSPFFCPARWWWDGIRCGAAFGWAKAAGRRRSSLPPLLCCVSSDRLFSCDPERGWVTRGEPETVVCVTVIHCGQNQKAGWGWPDPPIGRGLCDSWRSRHYFRRRAASRKATIQFEAS